MSHRQLSLDERYQIQAMVRARYTQAEISRELGRSSSTISRELKRNSDPAALEPYRAKPAQRRTAMRRVEKGAASRKIQGRLERLVVKKLQLGWSPEQISGRLLRERKIKLSFESIYQYVLADKKRHGVLRYYLRFGGYKQHRFKHSKVGARTALNKLHISDRPKAANERSELGHWERDCIVSTGRSSAIVTMVDRRSLYTRLAHVPRMDAAHVAAATERMLAAHKDITKTITNDNGLEFRKEQELSKKLNAPIYFCDPASPWQRGTVENTNGLIRQYLRKRTNFDKLHPGVPVAVENTLNFRPRKVLGYRTPYEVFNKERIRLLSGPLMRLGLEFSIES